MTQKARPKYRLRAPNLTEEQERDGVLAVNAAMNAAALMEPLQKNLVGDQANATALMVATQDEIERVQAGDLTGIEAMLVGQATALQTMFASLTRRAVAQQGLQQYQTFMALGLKAQAQSRATLQALIELKQPRHAATFIRQAYVAHGPQQVNNHSGNAASVTSALPDDQAQVAPAQEIQDMSNKLLAQPQAMPGLVGQIECKVSASHADKKRAKSGRARQGGST